VILAYQEACAQVIRRFEGYLARYVGGGLLVYFGYPQAHEDDAQRAVRAGLRIVAEMQKLNVRLQQTVGILRDLPLQVRVGIHTGLVVIGDMGGGGFWGPHGDCGGDPQRCGAGAGGGRARYRGHQRDDTAAGRGGSLSAVTWVRMC
jgi:class 3 adenylate cyclase